MTWRVQVAEDFPNKGVTVRIADVYPERIYTVKPIEVIMDEHSPDIFVGEAPALQLPNEMAMALLDGLAKHFGGVGDVRTLRADYLHERARVDAIIKYMTTKSP